MPSNNILINHTISYEVHDDKMPKLMKWLRENQQKTVKAQVTAVAYHSHKTA